MGTNCPLRWQGPSSTLVLMSLVSKFTTSGALLILASVPILSGCGAGSPLPTPTSPLDAAAADAAGGSGGADGVDGSGTDGGGSEAEGGGAPGALGDCVPGRWVLGEGQVTAFYGAVAASIPELEIAPFGTIGLTLDTEGTYAYAPDYGFVLTVSAGPVSIEPRAVVTGAVTGSWSIESGRLVLTETDSALAVDAQLNGQAFDVADLTNGLIESSPMLSSPGAVVCTSTTLTVPYETGSGSVDLQWDRVS